MHSPQVLPDRTLRSQSSRRVAQALSRFATPESDWGRCTLGAPFQPGPASIYIRWRLEQRKQDMAGPTAGLPYLSDRYSAHVASCTRSSVLPSPIGEP